MEKKKIEDVFDELLEAWYWAEDCCIKNMSGNWTEDMKELRRDKEEYKKRFLEALNS